MRTGCRREPQAPGRGSKTPGMAVWQLGQRPSASRFHVRSSYQSRWMSRASQPGQRVAIFEYSSGLTGDINTGDNIPFYNGLVGAYANAAVLRTPGGVVADYVGFGDALPGLPAGASQVGGPVSYVNYDATTQSHYRAEMQGAWPTFHTSDWVVYTKSR